MTPPPAHHGLAASRLHLPQGPWRTVLEALCAHFATIPAAAWQSRFARGLVLAADGQPLAAETPYREGLLVQYYREVSQEAVIPFAETVLYIDAHLVVADKPHFLPVTPAGSHVRETLLARLVEALGNPDLVPLHRIDRDTAGLVLFSANPASRAAYQALFRERRIDKHYEALAAPLPQLDFPLIRRSRLVEGTPFFRMQEVDGAPNSETRISVLEQCSPHWRYALQPVTGRKHQLRVHLAALGAAILNDPLYPVHTAALAPDYDRPLQLLAKALEFADPLTGQPRRFESPRSLLAQQ